MGCAAGYQASRANLVRVTAVAIVLALAGAACQTGTRSSGSGGSASTPLSAPAPAGGGTYAAFCGAGAGCPGGGVPAALRRRIHLPHLAVGARCPVSAPGRKIDPGEAAAVGHGPVYAFSLGPFASRAVMPFVLPGRALFGGSAWGGQILKWIGAPSYRGPVLIRGRKLTSRGGLGFGSGKVPLAEIDVPPGRAGGVGLNPGGWRLWSGYARLRSPGCYGLQVDGITFSEVIIFRACLSSPPRQQTGRCRSR